MAQTLSTEIEANGIQFKTTGTVPAAAETNNTLIYLASGLLKFKSSAGAVTGITDQIDITGLTAETTIADDDLIMIYDDSAGAHRKMTKANFVTGLGGGEPAYDSGWFSVASNTTYTKAHSIGAKPRKVEVWHSTASDGNSEWVQITGVYVDVYASMMSAVGVDATNVYILTGTNAVASTSSSSRRVSTSGYYRILAWE